MKKKDGTKKMVDLNQAMWIMLPKTGQVAGTLDERGVLDVRGQNPEFKDAPYCVHLGLRMNTPGSQFRYGVLDSYSEGDHFYAEIQKNGSFDIHLKAQRLSSQDVTIVWFAIPQNSTCVAGPLYTLGPTPIPTLPPDIAAMIEKLNPKDLERSVGEIPGIDPEYARRLTESGIGRLATLASTDAPRVAGILDVSVVRAMSFIHEAREMLRGKTGR